jgi:dihydroorotate dehydrogenase electron transfer subunit
MRANHRDSIHVEAATILAHDAQPAEQFAADAEPGSFAHLSCAALLPMRRPLSIMRTDAKAGWVEFLYKRVGAGTRLLSERAVGERLSIMGPIGRGFVPRLDRPRTLLIGGGVGIPPMIFLADRLRPMTGLYHPLVLMGSEVPFPFRAVPSRFVAAGMPADAIAGMPLLEDWGVPSRLASLQGYPGCFEGYVTDLARHWLEHLDAGARAEVMIFACGPHPMLEATARLAQEFALPCQLSLEELMACAVGGCAGCAVAVTTPEGLALKRVCVDGPVFDALEVFP